MNQCHYPGCTQMKPTKLYACRTHWFLLPKRIRDDIWRGFKYDAELWARADREAREDWAARIKKIEERDQKLAEERDLAERQGSLFA